MKNAIALSVITLFLLSGNCFAGQKITKNSLPDVAPGLNVEVRGYPSAYTSIDVSVPPDTMKSMFQAWFLIPKNEKGEQLRIQAQVHTVDGVRRISVSGSPDLLGKAVIQLDCKKSPRMSSIQTYDVDLSSFLGGEDRPDREKKSK